jgi:Flp pilus assembly protein TadD
MGRRRRRHPMEYGGNGGNGHNIGNPLVVLSDSLLAETLEPGFAPPRDPSVVVAPVLELEGLEPWAEIQGPVLALEETTEPDEPMLTFHDPAQLVLAPFAARMAAAISAEAPRFELEEAETAAAEIHARAPEAERHDTRPPFLDDGGVAVADAVDGPSEDAGFPAADDASVEDVRTPSLDHAQAAAGGATAPESRAPVGASDAGVGLPVSEIEAPAPPEPPAPDPAEALYAGARNAAEAGRAEEAKRLYRQLLALHPTHVRARNNLALMLDAEGNHQGALAELDRALDVEPENGTLLVNRGALLGAMGRYGAAERDLKRVLRDEPSHAEALFNLGVVMTKKGLWGEAVPHLRRAVELEPQRAAAHYYLGEALNHVDDLTGALAAYQRAAELQPDNPRALYGLGIIYDRLARPDAAAQMYRRSREVSRR